MKSRAIEMSEEAKAEIQSELKEQHPPHVYKRLMALKMRAVDGISSEQAGKHVGLHVSSVNKIIQRYKEQGIESLITKRHDHGNRYMTREEEIAFLQTFEEKAQAGQVIEVTEIHKAYQEAIGHESTRSALYYLLHKHGWRKVMPRGKHPKRASEGEIAAYQKNLSTHPKGKRSPEKPSGDVSRRSGVWTYQ